MKIHPNFFIVGAGKSGTTTLWYCLKQHPQVYMPEIKEPSFFSFHYKHNLTYESYLLLFSKAVEKKAIGEASHAYLTSPESAGLIKKMYPDAKIIIILRNPTERAFSLYQWMTREGYEWIYPFEKALKAEKERMFDEKFKYNNPQYYYNYLYYNSGLYCRQIQRYLSSFPKEQIKFLFFDDLKKDILLTMIEIYSFLEVDVDFTPDIAIKNKMSYPLSVYLQFFLRKKLTCFMEKISVPKNMRKKLIKYAMNTNVFLGAIRNEKFSQAARKSLVALYTDEIKKIENITGKELTGWYKV